MSKYELKNLPKGFRYLLTLKEIKEIESKGSFKFKTISTGLTTSAGRFKQTAYIQSSFWGVSVSSYQSDSQWDFIIYQSGFRSELLPATMESEIKSEVQQRVIQYITKVLHAKETDGLRSPKLTGLVMIIDGKPSVKWEELK
ncbi:MAG TPA: hypothetical protein VNS32_04385 [Flavisolibacter sp.]|nr:hypothetical protein [Flavisolibacter sp.]